MAKTSELDSRVRVAAFAFLAERVESRGEVLPRDLLATGFLFEGQRVPLIGPQGIFKPALLEIPLSLTTVPVLEGRPRLYEDDIDPDGLLIYRYRGTDPEHRDNRGLRLAMARKAPLIYFHGVVPGNTSLPGPSSSSTMIPPACPSRSMSTAGRRWAA